MRRLLPVVLVAAAAVGCTGDQPPPQASPTAFPAAVSEQPYRPQIDPARFTSQVDNPYFPLIPGTTLFYRGISDDERETDTVQVTARTKEILGVLCVVVRDEVKVDGERAELTFDWYAQDVDGNVWYFGEDSREYEKGKVVSTEGSWEAGVDGAQPGVIMPEDPEVGLFYRQEYFQGEAEDVAKVVSLHETARVPYGSFEDVLVTEDSTPLEPNLLERKYYARGIGVVFEELVKGGEGFLRLVRVSR